MVICNGLVRSWLRKNADVDLLFIPCRRDNRASVAWMYRDERRVRLISIPNRNPYAFISRNIEPAWRKQDKPITNLTCFEAHEFDPTIFDREFYRLADIPFDEKWNSSYFNRDASVELAPRKGALLIHDDSSRGFTLSRKRFPELRNATHVQDYNRDNVFTLMSALEQADELHVINSSIFNLMELANPKEGQKRFWHFYARPELSIPDVKLHWEKIT